MGPCKLPVVAARSASFVCGPVERHRAKRFAGRIRKPRQFRSGRDRLEQKRKEVTAPKVHSLNRGSARRRRPDLWKRRPS